MVSQVDLGKQWELRDASGSTLGYYLPADEYDRRFGKDLQRLRELEAEKVRWEQGLKELEEERARLRAEVKRLQAEREQYVKSLYALIPSHFSFSPEELLALEQNGLTLDQILEDFKASQRA